MSLETNRYVASAGDVEKLAQSIVTGELTALYGRGTYLKALIATTQSELGLKPRQNTASGGKATPAAAIAQLKGFNKVAASFYAIVVKVAKAAEPSPDKATLRARTGFARSAASTVRGYIRAGNDISLVAARKATKAALATPVTKRKPSIEALKARAVKLGAELEAITKAVYSIEEGSISAELDLIFSRVSKASGAWANPTSDADKAATERRPWQVNGDIFIPFHPAIAKGRVRQLTA
jgi:hypothetical protein